MLHLAANVVTAAATLPLLPRRAAAQGWPNRPVRWVVGFAPAGGNDIIARLMGHWLSERTGQQFIVENRPGAATNIATEIVVNAAPDGYTLLLVSPSAAINATLYDNLSFVFLRDIAPAAGIMGIPLFLVTNPSSRLRRCPTSSPTPKPGPARSTWARPASAAPAISPASCST
jgi:tripartite-type tricarboxylate transporter receptor subunit TctC